MLDPEVFTFLQGFSVVENVMIMIIKKSQMNDNKYFKTSLKIKSIKNIIQEIITFSILKGPNPQHA